MNEQQAFETVLRYVRAMAEYGPLASRLRKHGREGFEAVVLEAATRLCGNLPHFINPRALWAFFAVAERYRGRAGDDGARSKGFCRALRPRALRPIIPI